MAEDFKSILSEAKRRHEEEAADEALKRNKERDQRNQRALKASNWMRKTVMPIVEQAMEAFEQAGIPAEMAQDFEVAERVDQRARLSIWCPRTPGMKGPPQSTIFFIDSDGESFRVGHNEFDTSRPDRWSEPQGLTGIEEAVGKGIKVVADSYYARVGKGS